MVGKKVYQGQEHFKVPGLESSYGLVGASPRPAPDIILVYHLPLDPYRNLLSAVPALCPQSILHCSSQNSLSETPI